MPRPTPRQKGGAGRSRRKNGSGWTFLLLLALLGGGGWGLWKWRGHLPKTPGPRSVPAQTAEPPPGTTVASSPSRSDAAPKATEGPSRNVPEAGRTTPLPPRESAIPATNPAPRIVVSNQRLRRQEPVERPTEPFPRRSVTNLLEAQIVLAAQGISSGSIDGQGGAQTASALRAFQMRQGLEQTGWLDKSTREALSFAESPIVEAEVTEDDLAGLAPVPATWLGKSQAPALEHETLLERLAEESQSSPQLLRRLNPALDWEHPTAGLRVRRPRIPLVPARRPALVRVSLAGRHLRVFDDRGELMAHFPCSIARKVEKRPVGDLHVVVAVADPDYTFDPDVFPESAEAKTLGRKLRLPPGPNNPVGVAWVGLDRPGYGIHGTPRPEEVGRTESHGCFRLANWNADLFRRMAWVGLTVRVEP